VVAHGRDVVPGGEVLDDFNVRSQPRAGEDALEEIVAEHGGLGNAAGKSGQESVHVVDALPSVGPLAEQVLVDVRNSGRVGVDPRGAGKHAQEKRALARHRQRRGHSGLEHPIAFDDPPEFGVEARPVQGMRHLADQPCDRFARKPGVGV